MRVAVIGGGINGVMVAWEFAKQGCQVDLYERNKLMEATSRSSTKMLHGGLRYLEQGHFSLVHESLHERKWWVNQAPHLAKPFELVLPVHSAGRPQWQLSIGLFLYETLARGSGFPRGQWLAPEQVVNVFPDFEIEGLKGAYTYWDAQMDDYQLGLWAADQARECGVRIHENSEVSSVSIDADVVTDKSKRFDRVINTAGPWAEQVVKKSGLSSRCRLNLIRGTHLVINRTVTKGCVLQVKGEKRIVFLLPHTPNTALLGTTEIKQTIADPIISSSFEIRYLLDCYNSYFSNRLQSDDILDSYAGLRPVVADKKHFSSSSRESVIERNNKLVNVFGGKLTTSRSLAKKVVIISLQ